ncbi:UNVERIFIED_CONTAM: hypothetical protein PYX00_006107 [Menopon gallinae]|uniref:Uncharacterized protein n=1 Tax=Menopon gallinae TaxID=328185 RepID=A0AAW2HV73_9NEOP
MRGHIRGRLSRGRRNRLGPVQVLQGVRAGGRRALRRTSRISRNLHQRPGLRRLLPRLRETCSGRQFRGHLHE